MENKKYQYGDQSAPPQSHVQSPSTHQPLPPGQPQYYNQQHQYPPPQYPWPNHGHYPTGPPYQPSLPQYPLPRSTYQQAPRHPQYQIPPQYQPNNYSYNMPVSAPPLPPEPPLIRHPTPSTTKQPAITATNAGRSTESRNTSSTESSTSSSQNARSRDAEIAEEKKAANTPILVGKRRGKGRTLPTGVVKKAKTEDSDSAKSKDPWSQYMNEVRRYKDQSCEDDRKNRPLVK